MERNAAFATNDSILIYALCISSTVFPIVFQLSNSKVKKLTALQMKLCFPIPDCSCFWQPVFAYLGDSHRLISILALRICIRLLNVQGRSEWIRINILKTRWVLRVFRDFLNWLVQIRGASVNHLWQLLQQPYELKQDLGGLLIALFLVLLSERKLL